LSDSSSNRRFSQEFKDELVREVVDSSKPMADVARAYGVGAETLRRWVLKYREVRGGTDTEVTVSERARLRELEREVAELRAEAAFLKKASAYFAREQRW
jgi:transposase